MLLNIIIICGVILFVFWIFYGGKHHEFIGLAPFKENNSIKDYIQYFDKDTADDIENIYKEELEIELQKKNDISDYEEVKNNKHMSKGQRICKDTLEKWFKCPFVEVRPTFLKNPETGKSLELDCFNADFHLAVEYNGEQHYVYPNLYHRTKEEFIKGIRKDKYKIKECNDHGIHLISVPYTVKGKDIPIYIKERLPHHLRNLAIID